MAVNEDSRMVNDVCSIFLDITGIQADPAREAMVISHWAKVGWGLMDFRLFIDWQFRDEDQREFFNKPQNMNLRAMLNPKNKDIILDVLSGLRSREIIEKKRKSPKVAIQEIRIRMPCGHDIYREQYNDHMQDCFNEKGSCFHFV